MPGPPDWRAINRFQRDHTFDPSAGTHGGMVRQRGQDPAFLRDKALVQQQQGVRNARADRKLQELAIEQERKRRLQEVSDALQRTEAMRDLSAIQPVSSDSWMESAERLLEAGVMEDQIMNDPKLFMMTGAPSQEELGLYLLNRMGPFPPPVGSSTGEHHARR